MKIRGDEPVGEDGLERAPPRGSNLNQGKSLLRGESAELASFIPHPDRDEESRGREARGLSSAVLATTGGKEKNSPPREKGKNMGRESLI